VSERILLNECRLVDFAGHYNLFEGVPLHYLVLIGNATDGRPDFLWVNFIEAFKDTVTHPDIANCCFTWVLFTYEISVLWVIGPYATTIELCSDWSMLVKVSQTSGSESFDKLMNTHAVLYAYTHITVRKKFFFNVRRHIHVVLLIFKVARINEWVARNPLSLIAVLFYCPFTVTASFFNWIDTLSPAEYFNVTEHHRMFPCHNSKFRIRDRAINDTLPLEKDWIRSLKLSVWCYWEFLDFLLVFARSC